MKTLALMAELKAVGNERRFTPAEKFIGQILYRSLVGRIDVRTYKERLSECGFRLAIEHARRKRVSGGCLRKLRECFI